LSDRATGVTVNQGDPIEQFFMFVYLQLQKLLWHLGRHILTVELGYCFDFKIIFDKKIGVKNWRKNWRFCLKLLLHYQILNKIAKISRK
jgi:hypothetical protein